MHSSYRFWYSTLVESNITGHLLVTGLLEISVTSRKTVSSLRYSSSGVAIWTTDDGFVRHY